LDIRDYLAAAVIYETVSDWPQVNIIINPSMPNRYNNIKLRLSAKVFSTAVLIMNAE